MSSTTCRCFGGQSCPHAAAEAEEFFRAIKPGDLSNAIQEAVSDYVELRGLNGLCPDVTKWSQPPGPAAFLDAGLPKAGGAGSLPRGLSVVPGRCLLGHGFRGSRGGSNATGNNKKDSGCDQDKHNDSRKRPQSRLPNGAHGARRKKSSFDSVISNSSSIPSPTWEVEGPEGFVSQGLSFDSHAVPEASCYMGWDEEQTVTSRGVSGGNCGGRNGSNQLTPTLGNGASSGEAEGLPEGEVPVMDAKQLLRSLRQQTSTARSRKPAKSNGAGNHKGNRGGARTSHPGLLAKGGVTPSARAGAKFGSPPFFKPDAWDDTGLFTVARRPKTVPSTGNSKRNRRAHQKPTIETHTLAGPVFSRPSATPQVRLLLPSTGSLGGSAVVGTIPPGDLWHKGDDFGGGAASDGFGLWPKRRRKVGGGSGDVALEFLDVREAALVSVAEAMARRALPWQAQLCPRALQDLEIARVRVFHAYERRRRADCKVRQDEILKGRLMEEERAWELFARAQGEMFEHALDQVANYVKGWESNHAACVSFQAERRSKRVEVEEGLGRASTNAFEQSEADTAWFFRRSAQVDLMWDPEASAATKQREEQRSTAALATWSRGLACATGRLSGSIWLEATGARALASHEHARWRQGVSDMIMEDGSRAEADRAEERRRSSDRCSSVLQTAWESDQIETVVSEKSWNLQGWLSVGSHKLVQQTVRALIRRCSQPYAVRSVLWEARQAAEFAAAARAAAASQRAEDARELCDVHRRRKRVVRQHKQDLLLAEARRASAEEAERNRAATHTVETLLKSSVVVKRDAIYDRVQAERAKALATREAEAVRCKLIRAEMVGLQDDLDRETERLATSLRGRREEQDEQIVAEVSTAASTLREEKARADDREALLKETLLRERDKEDRMLHAWLVQQEQKGAATDRQQVSDARETLEEDRNQWVGDVIRSISRLADLDAAFFRDSLAWGNGDLNSSTAGNDNYDDDDDDDDGRAAISWAGIQARHALPLIAQEQNGGGAAEIGAAAPQPRGTVEGGNDSTHPLPDSDFNSPTVAAEIEALAAKKRCARLEALASLARQGMEAHWAAFFREEMERTRVAATALDLTAGRWAGQQRETVGALRASWCGRDWLSTATSRAVGGESDASGASSFVGPDSGEEGSGVRGTGTSSTDADAPIEIEGGAKGEGGQRQHGSGDDGGDDDSACVIVVRDVGASSGGSLQAISSDAEAAEAAAAAAAAAGQLVVFVGRTMAFHTSTIRASHLEKFDEENRRRRCSSFSAPPQQGQHEHRPSCVVSSIDGEDAGLEHCREAVWLGTLQTIAGKNTVVDLAVIGAAFGGLPGGAAVLCLAHDCLVEGDAGETEVLVNTDVFLSAALAFIALRRSIRAARGAGGGGRGAGGIPGTAAAGSDNVERGSETPVKAAVMMVDENPETSTSPGPQEIDSSPGPDERGDLGVGCGSGPFSDRSSSGTLTSTHLAAVAQMEVAVELAVFGDDLCADLAAIPAVSSAFYSSFPADDGSSMPPSEQPKLSHSHRTWRIRRAVEKHSALLSPQTVFALTAMLSAKAEAWAGHISHDGNSEPHAAIAGREHRGEGDGEGSLHVGDRTAWKAALSDALLAVRAASLEHLALWASACDPGRMESAGVADVLAEVASLSSSSSTAGIVALETDVLAAAAVWGAGHEKDRSGGGTEAIWASLHKASGVGLSPLMLLAATLSDDYDDHSYSGDDDVFASSLGASRRQSSVVRGADQSSADVDTNESRNGNNGSAGGNDGSGGSSRMVAFAKSTMRSAIRLLSSASIQNVSQCLSSQRPRSTEEEPSAPTTQNAGDQPVAAENNGGPEVLGGTPGHPAIGDLSCLDDETLRRGAEGVVAALDARGIGVLPPAILAVALQSGQAGFRLEPLQAQVVLRLAGCLDAKWQKKSGSKCGQDVTAVTAAAAAAESPEEGEFGYLGCPPRTPSVRYSKLVEKLPGLLRLVQGAHRLGKAASTTTSSTRLQVMDRGALERARQIRLRLGIERYTTSLATALEAVCQRMAYARLQRRSSLLEAPRLEAIQHLKEKAMRDAASAAKVRATEDARRAEVRMELTRATQARIAVASPSGRVMVGVRKARAAATSELCAAGGRATEQARGRLASAAERLGTILSNAEEELMRDEANTRAEDSKAREQCNQEPDWWGEGLTQEIEQFFRQEAMLSQDAAEALLEEASALDLSLGTTWEEDAQQCEGAFAETEKRLDAVMAEFENRRARSREAATNAANRDAASVSKAPSPQSSSSSEQRRTHKQQADFAELVQMRHRCTSLCRETLEWLGRAADDLEGECADLCQRAAGLPERTEKRLSAVLKAAHAKGVEERSTVAKRLRAGSKGWGDRVLERKLRWRNLRTSRRASFERDRARREAERSQQRPPRLGPVASAARTVVLAQALHTAGEPVRLFLDSVGNGPHAAAAAKTVEDAADAFPRAHRAVRYVVAAAGRGGAAGVSGSEAGVESTNGAVEQDKGGGGMGGKKDRAVIGEALGGRGTEGFTGAEVEANGRNGGMGDRGDSSGGRVAEAAAGEMLAMEREDAMARVSACRDALGGWWERQRAVVEEGLVDRENEAADRRTKREVHYLLTETVVTEIEARDEAERQGKRTTSLVLSKAKRIAEQFVDALRSADARISKAAKDAQAEVAEETEVLSLEAQSLSAKVSAALQRGLNTAADDIVAARRKGNRAGDTAARGTAAASAEKGGDEEEFGEEYGESVYGISTDGSAELAQQQHQHQQQAREYFPASASSPASASVPAPGLVSALTSASSSASASASSSKTSGTGSSGMNSRLQKQTLSFRGGPSKGGCRGG